MIYRDATRNSITNIENAGRKLSNLHKQIQTILALLKGD
jgi:hypothetical protein